MRNRVNKWLIAGLFISLIMIIIGYFLWAIDVPVDVLAGLTSEEVNQMQQELALNYSAGFFLLNLGFVTFTGTLIALVIRKLLDIFTDR